MNRDTSRRRDTSLRRSVITKTHDRQSVRLLRLVRVFRVVHGEAPLDADGHLRRGGLGGLGRAALFAVAAFYEAPDRCFDGSTASAAVFPDRVRPLVLRGHSLHLAERALEHAKVKAHDVLIIDTAGRLHVDDEMMDELRALHDVVSPVETLFVVDSMTGQDAVRSAAAFDQALSLTGIILTKADGDARGGAALSIRQVTGKPIKFLGMGESTEALEPFYPDRVASRILGMGDVVGLVEEVQRNVDQEKARKISAKLKKGKGFDFEDFREQLLQVESMGGLGGLMDKLPGASNLPAAVKSQAMGGETTRLIAIINSMTSHERSFPAVMKGSRKRRIAAGSGTQVQDVNRLLKQFAQMQKMMKKMKGKGGMAKMLGQLKGMGGPGGAGFPFQ